MVKSIVDPGNNYYENLEFFKKIDQGGTIPYVVYDVFANIQDPSFKFNNVYKYSDEHGSMVEITESYAKKRSDYINRVRRLPFNVHLEVKDGKISFSLGPANDGIYRALLGYHTGLYCVALPVDRDSEVKLFTGLKTYIRFVWESPHGYVAFSPEWFVDFSKEQTIAWVQ